MAMIMVNLHEQTFSFGTFESKLYNFGRNRDQLIDEMYQASIEPLWDI